MPAQSVTTTTLTRPITVVAGVFAPDHLGELTRYLPFELVDDVLAQTCPMQQRSRALPSRTGAHFVLALGLFPGIGYARVWAKLCAGLAGADGYARHPHGVADRPRGSGVADAGCGCTDSAHAPCHGVGRCRTS